MISFVASATNWVAGNQASITVSVPAGTVVGVAYAVGDKVVYQGVVYECIQAHESQVGWEPGTATASLWKQVYA